MQCQPYTLQSRLLNANILIMDNKETVFYLGEKDKTGNEVKPSSEKNYRIAYGGDLPFELEASDDKWNSPENRERINILTQKNERRSMVVRRLIYLERRQMEIITALSGIEKRFSASGDIRFQLIIVMLFAIGIPSWIVMIMSGVNIALALILPALFIAFCAVALKLSSASFKRKEEELAMMLRDIKEEHDSLEKEHDELLLEIKKLTDF